MMEDVDKIYRVESPKTPPRWATVLRNLGIIKGNTEDEEGVNGVPEEDENWQWDKFDVDPGEDEEEEDGKRSCKIHTTQLYKYNFWVLKVLMGWNFLPVEMEVSYPRGFQQCRLVRGENSSIFYAMLILSGCGLVGLNVNTAVFLYERIVLDKVWNFADWRFYNVAVMGIHSLNCDIIFLVWINFLRNLSTGLKIFNDTFARPISWNLDLAHMQKREATLHRRPQTARELFIQFLPFFVYAMIILLPGNFILTHGKSAMCTASRVLALCPEYSKGVSWSFILCSGFAILCFLFDMWLHLYFCSLIYIAASSILAFIHMVTVDARLGLEIIRNANVGLNSKLLYTARLLRHLQLLLGMFNPIANKIVFAAKIMALTVSIVGGFAAVKLALVNLPYALGCALFMAEAGILYNSLFNTAFRIPEHINKLKKGLTTSAVIHKNPRAKRRFKKIAHSVRASAIMAGPFHKLEKQSTPNFITFVARRIVTLLIYFK